jgi:hypothetical protein
MSKWELERTCQIIITTISYFTSLLRSRLTIGLLTITSVSRVEKTYEWWDTQALKNYLCLDIAGYMFTRAISNHLCKRAHRDNHYQSSNWENQTIDPQLIANFNRQTTHSEYTYLTTSVRKTTTSMC